MSGFYDDEPKLIEMFGLVTLEKAPMTDHIAASDLHDLSSNQYDYEAYAQYIAAPRSFL